jgi:hypothetical protein
VSCLCLWPSEEPRPSLEMDGMRTVLPISISSWVVVIAPFLALALGRCMAANHARKRVSEARAAPRHRLHHCIADRSAQTIPS